MLFHPRGKSRFCVTQYRRLKAAKNPPTSEAICFILVSNIHPNVFLETFVDLFRDKF